MSAAIDLSRAGGAFSVDTLGGIPASAKLRPPLDKLIVEPLGVLYSRYLIVQRGSRAVRGIVRAVGKGHNPLKYFDKNGNPNPPRMKRARVEYSKYFQPTEVKVGDVVELGTGGDEERRGYAFETFYWGDVMCVSCTERDVCGVADMTEAEAREQAKLQPTV